MLWGKREVQGPAFCVPRRLALYPYVRFATCGFLIVFTSIVGVGALMLLSRAVKRPLLASTEISRRAMPSVAERGIVEGGASNIVAVEAPPAAENAPAQPSAAAETHHTATPSPQPAPRNDRTAPEQATPVRTLAAEEQHVATPAIKIKA